jgi:PAS domain S-box-containing protein
MVIVLPVVIIAFATMFMVLRRRTIRGAASLFVFSLALFLWGLAYGYFLNSSYTASLVWLSLIYLGATLAATALLTFILSYTNHGDWLTRWTLLILAAEPLLTQVLIWVPRWRAVFYVARPDPLGLTITTGPWYWINQTYSDGLLVLALIFLGQTFLHKSRHYLLQSATLALGLFVPLAIKILSLANLPHFPNRDLAPFSYAITALLIIYCLIRFKLLDISMITRESVVENMSDGWMVIDNDNHIVDLNPAAESLIGVSREDLFGQPAEHILSNWPKLSHEPSQSELEIRGSLKLKGEWRFLNVRILPLAIPSGKQFGKVVLWRDITDRKKSDDARQRARDEMFVLLHSISGAASQTLNLNDFLVEAMHQIVYAFQSQVSLIFLLERGRTENDLPRYSLAAHHGVADANIAHLASSPSVARILAWVVEHREPFIVPEVLTEPRLPPAMQNSGLKTLLLFPLITGGQVLGVIGLTRTSGQAYGTDEISRLSVVSEELASLIYSDRQRQLAIALEERQRLVHDLHDSVTQKLYALVQLTEAAQASLETGTKAQSVQVVSRIGEFARQALKEMRLFLFEMKPVDLEHEGLVSVLHQRLATVEGKANVMARLITDDDISLPLEKQVTLYFIAQEALNNILKYANASSVMIRLKKRKSTYALEIEDDGRGFDPQNPGKGGMGLHIMQERLAKVNGKLYIKSSPGKGSKITATVGRDEVPNKPKKGKTK